ncbi:MAG: DUF2157 domain-containing protein, partial [Actinomycetota bacterium]|nr:DUF2157 domain-containing protein [Actinomycetota bacterium]
LQDWIDSGIVTSEQVDALAERSAVPRPVRRSRPVALIAEGLGYLGGALSVAAATAIASTFWSDLETLAQVALLALVAGLLVAGGAVAAAGGPAIQRLGSLLWFLSVAAASAATTLVAVEVGTDRERLAYLAVSVITTVHAAILWRLRSRCLQQLALAAGTANVVIALLVLPEHPPAAEFFGLAFVALGLAWTALTWGRTLRPERTGLVLGGLAVLGGSQVVAWAVGTAGILLGVASAGGLLAAGVTWRRLVALGLGAAGVLLFVPQLIAEWFGDTLPGALTLLVVGLLLLGAGLATARTRAAR